MSSAHVGTFCIYKYRSLAPYMNKVDENDKKSIKIRKNRYIILKQNNYNYVVIV